MSDEKGGPDSPVGDMSEAGQTEVGPYPSLTNVENMEQADLPAVAEEEEEEEEAEGTSSQAEGTSSQEE